jgi:hypothetical protein
VARKLEGGGQLTELLEGGGRKSEGAFDRAEAAYVDSNF